MKDPWVLGAFSVASPGGQWARMALSESLNEQLWFAGEAVHETLWGTIAGAWEAGERSADAAIRRLGKKMKALIAIAWTLQGACRGRQDDGRSALNSRR
jgi:myo-inositol catabolism protein IolC